MLDFSREEKSKELAFTPKELFIKYSDMVWRLALTRVQSKAYADDVLQGVFLRVVKAKPQFKDEQHAKAWLIKVTLNCANKLLSSAWVRHFASFDEGQMPDTYTEIEDNSLLLAVSKLKPKYRMVIHLYYYEDLKVGEISAMLNISLSAVKQRLKRAREELKDYMTGDEDIV